MKKVNKQLGMLQRAGAEKLGRAEKSVEELPEHIAVVQHHHEVTRANCERVQKKLSNNFQSSGTEYEKRVRKLPQTALANTLHEASSEMGTTPLAQILDLCGDVTQRIAMQTACFELLVEQELIQPLNSYLEQDAHALEKLLKKLQKNRLEMDSAASKVHKMDKRPPGTMVPEAEEKRLRLELESTESKFHSSQSQYITELLEVASKEHAMASNFVSMMEQQIRYHEECISRLSQTVPRMRDIIDNTPFRPSFGVDLATHCGVNDKQVSMVIENCCAALMPFIESEEGLFRIAGPVSQVKKLKAHIDYGLPDFSECSPHTITGVLKLYLRELPDPLFTEKRYEDWRGISMMGEAQHNEKMQLAYSYLRELPEVHYVNIRYLMWFLHSMIQYQDITKMGASNLALVIGPNLFVNLANADAHMQDTGPLCTLVESMIQHAEYFFPEGCHVTDLLPNIYATVTINSLASVSSTNVATRLSRADSSGISPAVSPCVSANCSEPNLMNTNGEELASDTSSGHSAEMVAIKPPPSPKENRFSNAQEGFKSAQEGLKNVSQEGLQKASKFMVKVKQKMK